MRTLWLSAKHFWQIHLTVALCTAVATGVLAGALIVGDSMQGSLQDITLERLGGIQQALISDQFFEQKILNHENTVPAILLNGTIVVPQTDNRASKVNIYGVESSFFNLWEEVPALNWNKTSNQPFADIIINEALQKELNVKVGDDIFLHLPQIAEIHPEFLLGTRDAADVIQSIRLVVSDIIPTENAGRFSLHSHQSLPLNAYISLLILQKELGQTDKVNVLFTSDADPISPDALELSLDALGLKINIHENHFDLQSQQYLLEPVLSETAITVANENDIPTFPTLTYLANTISVITPFEDKSTSNAQNLPYSTILALPVEKGEFAELLSRDATEDEQTTVDIEQPVIYLNKWAADDLGAKVGDKINITYSGVTAEEEYVTQAAQFLLKGIVPIEGIAADTNLIPKFPGIHDTATLSEWDPTFPFDYSLVRKKDEAYWDEYRATPKAFISLEIGKQLWQNRFGDLTSIRIGNAPGRDIGATKSLFETEFLKKINPEQIGFQFISLRTEALQSSTGSTDFGMLFASMSGFIIIAVALLVGMLFRIGVEQRSREIGILQALGYPLVKIRRRFLIEGIVVASIGSILGCVLAIGYGKLMIFGLQTWWLPAIGTPFIKLHVSVLSLLIGALISLLVVIFSIRMTVRKLGRISTVPLLAGETDFDEATSKTKTKIVKVSKVSTIRIWIFIVGIFFGTMDKGRLFSGDWSGIFIVIILAACGLFGIRLARRRDNGTNPNLIPENIKMASIFFGIGLVAGVLLAYFPFAGRISDTIITFFEHPVIKFLLLTITILNLGWTIFAKWLSSHKVAKRLSRTQFALKNAARQPSRSSTCVMTISLACCIIVAVGANRHDAPPETEYAFVAESSLPLHHSLNTHEGRSELGFDAQESELLSASVIIPFRVLPGEDVSCLNLYQPQKPQILGATEGMLEEVPWKNLKIQNSEDQRIPAIGDDKSLRWILHHNPKEDFLIEDEFGKTLRLHLDTIENSLFQSQLIISESDFIKHYPSLSGYQFFLIKTPPELHEETSKILEKTLSDYGFDVTFASERLASFRAVENTYISTFQSLGGLGILLGTFGLALVLLRNIIERRGELATLRAFGFKRQILSRMLFLESCFLLSVGMLIGTIAGLVGIIGLNGHLNTLPWFSLSITLLFIFGFGIIANAIVVSMALRSPLLSTLKSE